MIINEKDTLRKAFRLIRNIYSEDFISEISSAACENIAELEEFKDASTLLLYFPINNELSPLPLLPLALKMGKRAKSLEKSLFAHETVRSAPAIAIPNGRVGRVSLLRRSCVVQLNCRYAPSSQFVTPIEIFHRRDDPIFPISCSSSLTKMPSASHWM